MGALSCSFLTVASEFNEDFSCTLDTFKGGKHIQGINDIVIDGAVGKVLIQTSETYQNKALLSYEGIPESTASKFNVTLNDGRLSLSFKELYNIVDGRMIDGFHGFHGNVISKGSVISINGVVISGEQSFCSSDNDMSNYLITLTIPQTIPLSLTASSSENYVVKGTIAGDLRAKVNGTGSIVADEISNTFTHLSVLGTGKIQANHVETKRLESSIEGAGSMHLEGGKIKNLTACVKGTGDFKFKGTAHNVEASVSGVGSLFVQEATGRIREQKNGIGKIHIG